MTKTDERTGRLAPKPVWSVVAVYEDPVARDRAVGFCDQLVQQFWEEVDFDVSWWSFAQLGAPGSAQPAAQRAAQAELVVFAAASEGDLPMPVKAWVERWLAQRGERDGILADLIEPVASASGMESPSHRYLRNAAHRGAMDYLTHVPQDLLHTIPDSLDSFAQRADQVTSLLDGILHQQTPPPRLSP